MMFHSLLLQFLLYTLGFSWTSTAKSTSTLTKRDAAPVSTACGDIINSNGNLFTAKLVYQCLTSVPFNPAVAKKFIKYYRDSMQFQSTLTYLKDPPSSYQQPKVDFLGGLDRIQTEIEANKFANQYEFEASLQALIHSTHDGNVELVAGITGVFSFGASVQIASVSIDGTQLPKVYLENDLLKSNKEKNVWKPSAISTISGMDATKYLIQFAAKNAFGGIEPHSDWNTMMSSAAQAVQNTFNIWNGGAFFYPGDILSITLENGTKINSEWLAVYSGDIDTGPMSTGGDFYNFFVLGIYPEVPDTYVSTYESADADNDETEGPDVPQGYWDNLAYPVPDIAQDDLGIYGTGVISGYYLNNSDVAVLSIPSFGQWGDTLPSFTTAVTKFIKGAKAKGKTHIVIDLQQNYGGDTILAFDVFKQFFPGIDPYAGSRLRAHEPANIIGDSIANYWDDLDPKDIFASPGYYDLITSEWLPYVKINNGTNRYFQAWKEFYGPVPSHGDNFTAVQRYNLSDVLYNSLSLSADKQFTVYGYGGRKPANLTNPFPAENIIILTDGLCGGTCSVFLELMQHQGGVRTVAVGGQPSYGPMQASGLSRGAASQEISDLDEDIKTTKAHNKQTPATFFPTRSADLEVVVWGASFNIRDQVRKGEDVPLQFVYEAAHCRIFYTPQTFYNYTNLWKYAANAVWNDTTRCVKNSTGYVSTKGSDLVGPPSAVLPPKFSIETPVTKTNNLGALIMKIITPSTSPDPETFSNYKREISQRKKEPKETLNGKPCVNNKCDSADFVCYQKFVKACDADTGVPSYQPTCVKVCKKSAQGQNSDCGGSQKPRCKSLPEPGKKEKKNAETLNTGFGFCPPPSKACETESIKDVSYGNSGGPDYEKI